MTHPVLERMYAATAPPGRLVSVDGGSRRHSRAALRLPLLMKGLRRLLGWRLANLAQRLLVLPIKSALTSLVVPDPRPPARP
jgi:hypothetical protein